MPKLELVVSMAKKPKLTFDILKKEAGSFATAQSQIEYKELYGVTDGKAVALHGT